MKSEIILSPLRILCRKGFLLQESNEIPAPLYARKKVSLMLRDRLRELSILGFSVPINSRNGFES